MHVAESIGSTLGTMVAKAKVARKAANRSDVVRAAKRKGRTNRAEKRQRRAERRESCTQKHKSRAPNHPCGGGRVRKPRFPKATRHRGRVSRSAPENHRRPGLCDEHFFRRSFFPTRKMERRERFLACSSLESTQSHGRAGSRDCRDRSLALFPGAEGLRVDLQGAEFNGDARAENSNHGPYLIL